MFRPNLRTFILILLLTLLLVSCTAGSESYTDPRINPDEALSNAPTAGGGWFSFADSEFYTDPRINPDEALGDFSP